MGRAVANAIVQGHLDSIQAAIVTLETQITTHQAALKDAEAKLTDLRVAEKATVAGMKSQGMAVEEPVGAVKVVEGDQGEGKTEKQ